MPENNLLDFDGYTDSFYNRAIRNLIESFCSVETRRLEDIVSKRLEDEGTNFFGVMIRNYLETGAVKLDGIIKSSLSRSFLYGRRIWVHEIRLNTSNIHPYRCSLFGISFPFVPKVIRMILI